MPVCLVFSRTWWSVGWFIVVVGRLVGRVVNCRRRKWAKFFSASCLQIDVLGGTDTKPRKRQSLLVSVITMCIISYYAVTPIICVEFVTYLFNFFNLMVCCLSAFSYCLFHNVSSLKMHCCIFFRKFHLSLYFINEIRESKLK